MKPIILIAAFLLGITQIAQALNPSRTYKQRPDKYNMKYTEAKVKTNDGKATLNVWEFKAKTPSTQLLLIAHNGEGNMADYLRRVDQFTANGYNVVTFDYRGFGESSEFEIDNNMYIYPHFQDDMKTMIDYCRKNHAPTFNIYGWGIGAGLGLGVGLNREEIKKIIADTPFLSMEDLEERFASWDEPMEVPFAGYSKKYEPYTALQQSSAAGKKVLLMVGSNDILFKKRDMDKLKGLNSKVFVHISVVENPDRKDNFSVNKAVYFNAVSSFLKQ